MGENLLKALCNYSVLVNLYSVNYFKNVSHNYSLKTTIAAARSFIINQSESEINANPADIYLFQVDDETPEQYVKSVQS